MTDTTDTVGIAGDRISSIIERSKRLGEEIGNAVGTRIKDLR